ncbi:MAG: hormogonium polysaccharide biosynthesis protein HpsL [Cyanobacteria bacterium J06639_16]
MARKNSVPRPSRRSKPRGRNRPTANEAVQSQANGTATLTEELDEVDLDADDTPKGRKSARKDSARRLKGNRKGKGKPQDKQGEGAATRDDLNEPELSRKEMRAQERKAQKERQKLIQATAISFAICAVIGLVVGLATEIALGVGLGFGLLCLALSFQYPRLAIYAFIIYVPFSGTVVYALGGSSILQLAKDAFYLPALFAVIHFCRRKNLPFLVPKSIKFPFLLLLTLSCMTLLLVNVPQQFASGDSAIAMGLLGLKTLFGYLFVIPCIYYLIRNREDLYFILRLQVILIIVACSLGLIQYLMLKTGTCRGTVGTGSALFKASLEARCFVGGSLLYTPQHGQIRLPGTFVAPWQWGWFLISSAFFSFGTAFSDRSPFWRALGLASMVVVAVMAVLSGQRIALMLVPVSVGVLAVLTGQVANLKRFIPIGIVLGLILTYLVIRNPDLVQARIESFQGRWRASPPNEFIAEQFHWSMEQQEGMLGRGVGRATNAARIFGKVELVETYHPKVLFEIGLIGLASLLVVYTVLVVATFKAYRSTKEKNLRGYAASMWVFVLFISYFPYYYPLDVDPVNVYYWLAAGIALKVPEIDKQERLQKRIEEGRASGKLSKKLKAKQSQGF